MEQLNKKYIFICHEGKNSNIMLKPGAESSLGRQQFPDLSKKVGRKHVQISAFEDKNQNTKIRLKPLKKLVYFKKHRDVWRTCKEGDQVDLCEADLFSLCRNSGDKSSTFSIKFCTVGEFKAKTDVEHNKDSVQNEYKVKSQLKGLINPENPLRLDSPHIFSEKTAFGFSKTNNFDQSPPPFYNPPSVCPTPKKSGPNWKMNLLNYLKRGYKLPEFSESIYYEDDNFVVIYDGYPKARIHLLLMPREHISYLSDLEPDSLNLVDEMIKRSKWIISHLEERHDLQHQIISGFHANPSMCQIHLHIVSVDMNSKFVKKRAHWNSFNTPFFLPITKVRDVLSKHGSIRLDNRRYSEYLKRRLQCNKCDETFSSIFLLKKHIDICKVSEYKLDFLDHEILLVNE